MSNESMHDRPVSTQEEDRFQRYPFSKRIAQTIIDRSSTESLVIGIYGSWGEGKTSVLNFIKAEISSNAGEFIQITFNPWRYKDETALLTSFFNVLAREIKKVTESGNQKTTVSQRIGRIFKNNKSPLKSSTENIGDLLKNYSGLLSFTKLDGTAKVIGNILSRSDVDSLRNRIDKLLKAVNRRIVIYIDDIDRLDKEEILAIFKLVKLTGDFYNTIYVLPFDDKVVSSALAEKYAGLDSVGEGFLEKIIQVPLKLPVAQPMKLLQMSFDLINKVLAENNEPMNELDSKNFSHIFHNHVLCAIKTPRLVVRYYNAIAFVIPLLVGESSIEEVLLVEALHIFYPDHYKFLKENPTFFIEDYKSNRTNNVNEDKKKYVKERLGEFDQRLSRTESINVRHLLGKLFPLFDTHLNNGVNLKSDEDLSRRRKIASSKYFARYFTYAVIEGEISDIEIHELINLAEIESKEILASKVKKMLSSGSPDELIDKLLVINADMSWERFSKLALALVDSSRLFPKPDLNQPFSFVFAPNKRLSYNLAERIKKHKIHKDRLDLVITIINQSPDTEFAFDIKSSFYNPDENPTSIFSDQEFKIFNKILLDRVKIDIGDSPLYYHFPGLKHHIYAVWKDINEEEMNKCIYKTFDEDPYESIELIKNFTNGSDFREDQYKIFKAVFDLAKLKAYWMSVYPQEKIDSEKLSWVENSLEFKQTDINLLKQFFYWEAKNADSLQTKS